MSPWCVLFVAVGLLLAPGAWAARTPFQIRCEDEIGKTVSLLTTQSGGYTVDTHLSYKTLTQMKGAGTSTYVLGLTQTESRVEIGLGGLILQDAASSYECMAPRVTVNLFYVPVVIYIGSEFAPGSCPYQAILKHELRHLKAYMDHLPIVASRVRVALAKRFQAKPLYAFSGTARAALESELDDAWMAYIKAEMGKVELQQAAIDSPEEYARLGKCCHGEILSILAPPRRNR